MRKAILVTPHRWSLIDCDDGDTVTLHTLQELVGGYIETVPSVLAPDWAHEPVSDIVLVVNEEGRLMGLPRNENATDMAGLLQGTIVGDTVLMAARGDELIGFLPEAADKIVEKWLEEAI